jgi:hypothetical protein
MHALLAVLVLTMTGCTSDEDPVPVDPTTTPLTEVDLSGVEVARGPLCQALDEEAVTQLLGGRPTEVHVHDSGDRIRLADGSTDVAHEYGCTFRRGPVTARTWVFAQPVAAREARHWAEELAGPRCRPTGPLEFGAPGAVVVCADRRATTVRMAGLFGDAWLTCEVPRTGRTTQDATAGRAAREIEAAAQRWCADVAATVSVA